MTWTAETKTRFLSAIADRLGAEQVAEVHLFPPIRAGIVESGVAVVAAGLAEPTPEAAEADEPVHRLAVHTAKYRLILKGPDRGKWDFSMQADADAPLVTVDAVVRGVQRRTGDEQEPERLTPEEFRAALPAADQSPPPATPSPS